LICSHVTNQVQLEHPLAYQYPNWKAELEPRMMTSAVVPRPIELGLASFPQQTSQPLPAVQPQAQHLHASAGLGMDGTSLAVVSGNSVANVRAAGVQLPLPAPRTSYFQNQHLLVPANPYLVQEIPHWLRVYLKVSVVTLC
jgi:hypothetical protein